MSDRRPPRSRRRDGTLPPIGARTPGLDDLSDELDDRETSRDRDLDDPWDDDEWDEPNYLIRRAATIGGAVVLIAVLALVVLQLVGGDDGGSSADLPDADWNAVVVLADREVRVVDPDSGDVLDTFDSADDLLDAQSVTAGNVLVTMTDAGRITQTDLVDGSVTRGRAGLDESLRSSAANSSVAIVGPDGGGDITIVDTTARSTLGVGDLAGLDDPLIFPLEVLVNASGSHAAMSDARSFQSVVVDISDETTQLLAGQIVAIGNESVVTAQRAGASTELEFYALAGERIGSVDVTTPVATMLTPSGAMLLVDEEGNVEVGSADGSVNLIGVISDTVTTGDDEEADDDEPADPPPVDVRSGSVHYGGTRLLVTTAANTVLLDDDGDQVAVVPGALASTSGRNTRCVVVGTSRTANLVDLDDGSIVAELGTGIVAATSADGCTVAMSGGTDGARIVSDGDVVEVDADSIVDVAPDGSAYVVLDGRDTEFVSIDGDDQIELSDEPSVIRFADR